MTIQKGHPESTVSPCAILVYECLLPVPPLQDVLPQTTENVGVSGEGVRKSLAYKPFPITNLAISFVVGGDSMVFNLSENSSGRGNLASHSCLLYLVVDCGLQWHICDFPPLFLCTG